MVKHPIFGEVSNDFNEAVALDVYNGFMEDPEYYRALLHMHAHEIVNKTILESPEIIDELIIGKYNTRKELVKEAVLNGVVNKSMSNSTVDSVVATMDVISKAMDQYTSFERAEDVKRQRRDVGGRFVPMGTTRIDIPRGSIGQNQGSSSRSYWNAQTAAYDRVTREKHGVQTVPEVRNSRSMNAAHSAAYLQVADALAQIDPTDMLMADINYTTQSPDGTHTGSIQRTKIGSTVDDFITPDEYGNGEVPTSIKWYMDSDSAGYGRFDVLTGAGASTETAMDLSNAARRSGPAARTMNETLGSEYTDEMGGQKYRGLGAVASMIETVGGDRISPQGKAALSAAKYVGEYGSEAEKVLGPTARRSAYRYRGTERKPDPKMDTAIAMSVRGARDVNDAHEQLIHPQVVTEQIGLDFEDRDEHSAFIKYWQNQLPSKDYIQLHLDSGTTPPSQGVVFDAKGQIITQSVGYGDDHYLPFNLKKLAGANRGEWIRTRTMGGPTTEDIYAGLITGTRAITVVSHSGEYVVEFDDTFRGGRRMNDKTKRMVRRYAQLLDTLDAESTTLQKIPPERLAELRASVDAEIPGEGKAANEARHKRFTELKEVEKQNPKASASQHEAWTAEFGQKYAEKLSNNTDEDEKTWEGVKANIAIRGGMFEIPTDEQAIFYLENSGDKGIVDSYKRFILSKEGEYRAQQRPLKLNGQGYYFALQALQEQFPYAIKRVEWYPTDDEASKDQGYVPHNFNRPKAAKEGFWSPEVEGVKGGGIKNLKGQDTGKVAAHHTNYQNYAARQRVGLVPAGGGGGTPRAATAPAAPQQNERQPAPAARITDTGVQFAGFTPNAQLTNDGAVRAGRRIEAVRLAEELADVRIRPTNANGQRMAPIRLGSANFDDLRHLTTINDQDLEDPQVQDALADEISRVLDGSANVPLANGGAGLQMLIREATGGEGQEDLIDRMRARMAGGRLEVPRGPRSLDRANVRWDFSTRDVDGSQFLPGNQQRPEDYRRTMNSDDDIQAMRQRHAREGLTWETFVEPAIRDIKAAAQKIAEHRTGTYNQPTIEYAGAEYGVDALDDLAVVLQQDAVGILKYRQLRDLMPAGTDLFVDVERNRQQANRMLPAAQPVALPFNPVPAANNAQHQPRRQ
jgi:hypothetical protein